MDIAFLVLLCHAVLMDEGLACIHCVALLDLLGLLGLMCKSLLLDSLFVL